MWASKMQQKNDIFTTEHKIISQSSLAYFIVPNYSYLILKEVKSKPEGNNLKICIAHALNICKSWFILHTVPWLCMKPKCNKNKVYIKAWYIHLYMYLIPQ